MARTRAQGRQETNKGSPTTAQPSKTVSKKRARSEDHRNDKTPNDKEAKSSAAKKQKSAAADVEKQPIKDRADALISKYGVAPLSDLGLPGSPSSDAEKVLALVFNAMLTSARISHELAHKSVKCLIEANYQDLETLSKSTWQAKTEVLTEGGYTRYREKIATALEELAELAQEKYDGDLNKILKKADSQPDKVRALLKEIKGIGNVGVDIFCDTAQGIWPSLAPFIDPRSMKTAEQCGLGSDLDAIWEAVGKDPQKMTKLAAALTTVRLDKKEREFA
ncbi:MAG: hypothetical protein Q9218_004977 [Villophora microphyllina]